ncbi:MAG: FAD-dependent oxidoreductase [Desulfovermiculus sp.]
MSYYPQGRRDRLEGGNVPVQAEADPDLKALQAVLGSRWVTNDPAVLLTYANDPYPLAGMRMPRFVAMPGTKKEVADLVRVALDRDIPYVVRGNGGSVFGFVFSQGLVIDMNRMKGVRIDLENWTAVVEPGVTAFELQQEAFRHGLRANTAEPAATVCGNIVCTGLFSTWANVYGVNADHFVDMEFVDSTGDFFRLNQSAAPNAFCKVRSGLVQGLGLEYAVLMIGDRYAREAILSMGQSVIDQDLFRMLMLGLPRLADEEWLDLVAGLDSEQPPYEILFSFASGKSEIFFAPKRAKKREICRIDQV